MAINRMDKENAMYTMGYYSAFKKREILSPAAMMNLKDIILSKTIQSQKERYCVWFHLEEVSKAVKLLETERRMMVARGWGVGERVLFNGYRVSVLQYEKVLESCCTMICM